MAGTRTMSERLRLASATADRDRTPPVVGGGQGDRAHAAATRRRSAAEAATIDIVASTLGTTTAMPTSPKSKPLDDESPDGLDHRGHGVDHGARS